MRLAKLQAMGAAKLRITACRRSLAPPKAASTVTAPSFAGRISPEGETVATAASEEANFARVVTSRTRPSAERASTTSCCVAPGRSRRISTGSSVRVTAGCAAGVLV